MIRIPYQELKTAFYSVLLQLHFSKSKAELCAKIFANNTLDGVNSHGINRFPSFIKEIKSKTVDHEQEPEKIDQTGQLEVWDGHFGIGMYNATIAMDRAIQLSKKGGIGVVFLKNNTHWMRGGTYGWQAAGAGCIGICFTNAIPTMPPYGGKEPRLGNNPIVIAVPRKIGPLVLDMALSQFSYGKMESYQMKGEKLPLPGGYDQAGNLTDDPKQIRISRAALPIGYWKGSGLALLLDILLTAVSGGNSTYRNATEGREYPSQCFISIYRKQYYTALVEEILSYTQSSTPLPPNDHVYYPGEQSLLRRKENLKKGISVEEEVWKKIKELDNPH